MEEVVTVGLDGSAESFAAAQWGADEAERRRARLRLLHAGSPVSPETADRPGTEVRNQWARQMVHDTAAELSRDRPGLRVEEELVAEATERALLDAAEEFFFGDISLHVVARAGRPVVVGLSLHDPQDEPLEFAFQAAPPAVRRCGLSMAGP
ncbi:universal stress protein [Streptomyces cucumeris]|uniref:universal stress protein n=1 Tax=Streptomyces cucumeris TaxID=2962890 RepID=UPI003D7099D0